MTTIVTERPADTATVQDEFLAIVSSDVELLRAEFEAIIAAEWPDPPSDDAGDGDTVDRPPHLPPWPRTVGQARLVRRPICPGKDRWCRERSPPLAKSATYE